MSAEAVAAALPMLVLALAAAAIVGALMGHAWWAQRRRSQIRARPFPAAWRRILRRSVPIVARLPSDLQIRLRRHIQVFLAEKPFIGCNGQAITDEVRVTVAAHACLLLIGYERPEYYPRLRQILVYPDAFVVNREPPVGAGLMQEQRRTMVGESWGEGQVILSWAEVVAGAASRTAGWPGGKRASRPSPSRRTRPRQRGRQSPCPAAHSSAAPGLSGASRSNPPTKANSSRISATCPFGRDNSRSDAPRQRHRKTT